MRAVNEKIKVVGVVNNHGQESRIDFYLKGLENRPVYAFSRKYTHNIFDLCKGGIRANALMTHKSHDIAVMKLVKQSRRMIPYLIDYYKGAA